MRSDNKSGITGIKQPSNQNVYIVNWHDENKVEHNKTFSFKKFGILEAFAAAMSFRKEVIKDVNKKLKNNQYTDSHGEQKIV